MCLVCEARRVERGSFRQLFENPSLGFAEPSVAFPAAMGDLPQSTSAIVTRNLPSGDRNVDALIGTFRFTNPNLTFAFPISASEYGPNYGTTATISQARTVLNTFLPTSQQMQMAARFSFAMASSVSGLTLGETTGSASIRIGVYRPPNLNNSINFAQFPGTNKEAGDVWLVNDPSLLSTRIGEYGWYSMLHEIGHALGMTHGHTSDGVGRLPIESDKDSMEFSVMTYRSYPLGPLTQYTNERGGYPQTFMMYDIAALQAMYGANFTINSSDTSYSFSAATGEMSINGMGQGAPSLNRLFLTVWDGGGNDTYNFSTYGEAISVDLRPGLWSRVSTVQTANLGNGFSARGNVFNALQYQNNSGSLIENAIGGNGSDSLLGNQANNILEGRDGNDTLDSGAGDDSLIGGTGQDVLNGGDGNDVLEGGDAGDNLNGGEGFDFATYANAASGLTLFLGGGTVNTGEANSDIHASIEGLIGSQFSDIIGGDAGINDLRGLDGNDFIYGRAGLDTLLGGDGNDVLSGGLDGDHLDGGSGIDVAFYREATAGITASLSMGGGTDEAAGDTYFQIENIWGSDFDDLLAGDNNAGQVYGFAGNDNLSGLGGDDFFYGGTGADTITGGDGIDSSFFLSWNDHVNQFGTPEPYEGGDTFTDFASGNDRVILSRFWFGFGNIGGPAAALTETHADFVTNGSVATGRPSLIWNNSARTLSFDADGNGATQAVLLGTFQGSGQLVLGDIWTA